MNLKTKKFCEYCSRHFDFFIKTFLLFEKVFWLCCCCCCSLTSFQEKEFFCQHKMDERTKMTIYLLFYTIQNGAKTFGRMTLGRMECFISYQCAAGCQYAEANIIGCYLLITLSLSTLSLSLFLSLSLTLLSSTRTHTHTQTFPL